MRQAGLRKCRVWNGMTESVGILLVPLLLSICSLANRITPDSSGECEAMISSQSLFSMSSIKVFFFVVAWLGSSSLSLLLVVQVMLRPAGTAWCPAVPPITAISSPHCDGSGDDSGSRGTAIVRTVWSTQATAKTIFCRKIGGVERMVDLEINRKSGTAMCTTSVPSVRFS